MDAAERKRAANETVKTKGSAELKRAGRMPAWSRKHGSGHPDNSTHAAAYNTFNVQRHLISRRMLRRSRAESMARWHAATAAA